MSVLDVVRGLAATATAVALTLALTGVAALSVAAAAPAAAKVRPALSGNDVSWPQCPKRMGIPERRSAGLPMPASSAAFVVIGLTNGPAFTPNPCLSRQVAWAKAHHVWTGAYAVTTYPTGEQWARYADRGPRKSRDALSRLRNVGYAQAQYNLANARNAGLRPPHVWIDVEPYPVRPWPRVPAFNRALIQGVVAGYTAAGVRVGFYSYANGWREIVGAWRRPEPVWATAGRRTRAAAAAMCRQPSFSGGRPVLGQWYDDRVDSDLTCPGITGATASRGVRPRASLMPLFFRRF